MADPLPVEDPRLTIRSDHQLAAMAVRVVSVPLAMWAGCGECAEMSVAARDRAGRRALRRLDAAIGRLMAVRDQLAHIVGPGGHHE